MKLTKSFKHYIISHEINIPSRLSDYDYDPSNPDRRFLSTYIHKITFLDPVVESELATISFGSFTCAELISGLYEMLYGDSKSVTIENVFTSKEVCPDGIIILTKNQDIIKFTICNFISPSITLDICDAEMFIEFLNSDELEDLFLGW